MDSHLICVAAFLSPVSATFASNASSGALCSRPRSILRIPSILFIRAPKRDSKLLHPHAETPSSRSHQSQEQQQQPSSQSQPRQRVHRQTDERGFLLPVPGDIVTFAGRWPGEDYAGLVEQVRYIPARGASVVDIVDLRNVGTALYAPSRRRRWLDVAEVRLASDAVYVPAQDAYQIKSVRTGYKAPLKSLDPVAKAAADREYDQLKQRMLFDTAAFAALGTAAFAALAGPDWAFAYALGATASLLYLLMLQRVVDVIAPVEQTSNILPDFSGPASSSPRIEHWTWTGAFNPFSSIGNKLLFARFLVPALPFLILSIVAASSVRSSSGNGPAAGLPPLLGFSTTALGSISKSQVAAVVVGLLTYKVPLFLQTATETIDAVAEADISPGSTGMLGTAATIAARSISNRFAKKSSPGEQTSAKDLNPPDPPKPLVMVIAGPSGVGKTALLRRLFREFPGVFDFCVSHTTRVKREREQDGVSYHFIDEPTFKTMIEAGDFVEYACVHDNYYGTSFTSVDKVLQSGKLCVLDLDVQGVQSLASRKTLDWSPRFIWVAPPSMAALEQRMRSRGSETEESLARRLETATREMAFAATSQIFDTIIINDNFDDAYVELKRFVSLVLEGKV